MMKKSVLGLMVLVIVAMGVAGQAAIITNGSFEDGERFAYPGYASGGEIPGWTYSGPFVGISPALDGRHEFDYSLDVPDGSNIAFIKNTGSLSQDITLTSGNYTLSWYEARRPLCDTDNPARTVKVKDSVGTVIQSSSEVVTNKDAYVYKTMSFTVPESGIYTLSFSSISASGGSSTLLLDNVVVTPEPATIGLIALGGLAGLCRRRRA